jgi:hypothetical protein
MQSRGSAIGTIGRINQGFVDNSNRAIGSAVQNKKSAIFSIRKCYSNEKNQKETKCLISIK